MQQDPTSEMPPPHSQLRLQFPLEMNLDWILEEPGERPAIYCLHAVLVHSGTPSLCAGPGQRWTHLCPSRFYIRFLASLLTSCVELAIIFFFLFHFCAIRFHARWALCRLHPPRCADRLVGPGDEPFPSLPKEPDLRTKSDRPNVLTTCLTRNPGSSLTTIASRSRRRRRPSTRISAT